MCQTHATHEILYDEQADARTHLFVFETVYADLGAPADDIAGTFFVHGPNEVHVSVALLRGEPQVIQTKVYCRDELLPPIPVDTRKVTEELISSSELLSRFDEFSPLIRRYVDQLPQLMALMSTIPEGVDRAVLRDLEAVPQEAARLDELLVGTGTSSGSDRDG